MESTLFQATLRRWGEICTSRNFFLVFVAVVVCSAAIGPFGTYDRLTLVHRFGFWALAHSICWALGILCIVPIRLALERHGLQKFLSFVIAVVVANFVVGPVFVFILKWETANTISFTDDLQLLLAVVPFVALISYTIIVVIDRESSLPPLESDSRSEKTKTLPVWANSEQCPIQQRLAVQNRGVLLAMVAQDHYIDVLTDKGHELILMRLSDAAELCSDADSLRVHRSAWISRPGIADVEKSGRSTKIILTNGNVLPVSRSMEQKLAKFMSTPPQYDATDIGLKSS